MPRGQYPQRIDRRCQAALVPCQRKKTFVFSLLPPAITSKGPKPAEKRQTVYGYLFFPPDVSPQKIILLSKSENNHVHFMKKLQLKSHSTEKSCFNGSFSATNFVKMGEIKRWFWCGFLQVSFRRDVEQKWWNDVATRKKMGLPSPWTVATVNAAKNRPTASWNLALKGSECVPYLPVRCFLEHLNMTVLIGVL